MEDLECVEVLGTGATSYVFKAILDGEGVAAKWMTKKNAQKEMENILTVAEAVDPSKTIVENHLLLPMAHVCGTWGVEDIVGSSSPTVLFNLKSLKGPGLTKDRKTGKYKLRGTAKDLQSCLLVFPLMAGDLEEVDLQQHDVNKVQKDIRHALQLLHAHDPPIYHEDVALRNIFYYVDEEGQTHYLLGDFGKISMREDYDVAVELRKITSKF